MDNFRHYSKENPKGPYEIKAYSGTRLNREIGNYLDLLDADISYNKKDERVVSNLENTMKLFIGENYIRVRIARVFTWICYLPDMKSIRIYRTNDKFANLEIFGRNEGDSIKIHVPIEK